MLLHLASSFEDRRRRRRPRGRRPPWMPAAPPSCVFTSPFSASLLPVLTNSCTRLSLRPTLLLTPSGPACICLVPSAIVPVAQICLVLVTPAACSPPERPLMRRMSQARPFHRAPTQAAETLARIAPSQCLFSPAICCRGRMEPWKQSQAPNTTTRRSSIVKYLRIRQSSTVARIETDKSEDPKYHDDR